MQVFTKDLYQNYLNGNKIYRVSKDGFKHNVTNLTPISNGKYYLEIEVFDDYENQVAYLYNSIGQCITSNAYMSQLFIEI